MEPLAFLADPTPAVPTGLTHTLDGRLTFNIIDGFDSTTGARSDKEKPGRAGSLKRVSGLATPIASGAS
jgi:hypothetical protein